MLLHPGLWGAQLNRRDREPWGSNLQLDENLEFQLQLKSGMLDGCSWASAGMTRVEAMPQRFFQVGALIRA